MNIPFLLFTDWFFEGLTFLILRKKHQMAISRSSSHEEHENQKDRNTSRLTLLFKNGDYEEVKVEAQSVGIKFVEAASPLSVCE